MPVFSYRAATSAGDVEEGVVEASDERGAAGKLRDSGLIPLRLRIPEEGAKRSLLPRSYSNDVLVFMTELSVLLNSGLPLDRSLSILSRITESRRMKEIIPSLVKSVREGSSFSEALQRHPKVFRRIHVSMARAGESGGVLNSVLERLVGFMEAAKELRDSVVSALIYPAILVFTAGFSVVLLLAYVVPKFTVIFEDFGRSIPFSTKILLGVSGLISSYWWLLFSLAVVFVFAFRRFTASEGGRIKWDGLKLRAAGGIIGKLETARFARTLGTLLGSGVPLLGALSNAKDVIGNRVISSSVDSIIRGAKEGKGVSQPMSETGLFPELAVSMIKVGEETGQLDAMLIRVAEAYEKSLGVAVKRFMSILEPVIIVGMGGVVGFIVMSMLLAIFSINELPF